MARTRGSTRSFGKVLYPFRSLLVRQFFQERGLVDPSGSGNWVSDEFKEDDGDQEIESEGDHEEEKEEEEEEEDQEEDGRFGIDKEINGNSGPENQDPFSLYRLPENENGYDNSSDDHDRNEQCQTQPGMSRDFSDPEQDTGTMKEGNDYKTGMGRLKVWLDQMGLGKYAPLFDLHDVDDDVLRFLTLEDLKDMGFSSVGSRWKIYRYIQNFCII